MSDQTIYLDPSAIVKRYVIEKETDKIDKIYEKAHAGKIRLSFSVWNIGETAVVLDKYHRRGVLENEKEVFSKFIGETRLLVKLGQLKLIPLNLKMLIESTAYVFKHGIYIADAVQLASAKHADGFLTFDKKLVQIAKVEGLKVAEL